MVRVIYTIWMDKQKANWKMRKKRKHDEYDARIKYGKRGGSIVVRGIVDYSYFDTQH